MEHKEILQELEEEQERQILEHMEILDILSKEQEQQKLEHAELLKTFQKTRNIIDAKMYAKKLNMRTKNWNMRNYYKSFQNRIVTCKQVLRLCQKPQR